MRILILCIFFSSLVFSLTSQNIVVTSQSFSLDHHTTSLIIQLNGAVEVVYWNKEEILVETTIHDVSTSTSNYSLNYSLNKGNFDLDCSFTEDANTLLLKPEKINNTIYHKGHQQKTNQSFKVFIPTWLQHSLP